MESSSAPFERRVVFSLASLYAFRMLGLFMLLPVLMLYGQDYQHANPFWLGLAMGAYGFSQAVLQIPFGVWSDRIGRKPVILAGLLIFALGSVVAALADSVYELIAGRFLQGCGAISAAVMALMIDLTSEEKRTRAMATIGASIGVSFSIALVLGPLMAAAWGMASIFWLTALLALTGIYILYRVIPEVQPSQAPARDARPSADLFGATLRHTDLARLNFGIFVLHFILMASFLVLPLLLEQQLQIPRESLWKVYLPLLGGAFIAMLPLMIIAEKKRRIKPVFLMAVALLALMQGALMLAPQWHFVILPGLFLFFMAFNLLEATLPSWVSKVAPAGAKGTATGIYSTFQFLGAFLGGAAGGALLHHYGQQAVLMVCGLAVLVWLLVAWFMTPPRYLASVLIPLRGRDGEQLAVRLRSLEGVEEILILPSEQTVYLKVDPRRIDRQTLTALIDELPDTGVSATGSRA